MPPLLAVPNVSEGRDARAASPRCERAFTAGRDAARPPLRRRPRPHRLHPRRRGPAPLTRGARSPAPRRRSRRSTWPPTAAPTRRSARSTSARSSGSTRPTATPPAPRRSRSPTQIGGLGVPVFLYGELARDPSRAERAYFRNGGLAELWLRMEAGELRPDFGPALPHRTRRRDPGHRPPAAGRLQRRARQRRRRGRPRRRRRAARVGRRPAGRAGDRPAALQRPRPGLDQRPRPARGAAGRGRRAGAASWRRRSAPARSRPSWSAWSRRPRSPATRRTCRSAASTPPAQHDRGAPDGCVLAADRLDFARHGPDEEEAPAQAPRHPGRPDRHQPPPQPPAQPRGGESARPLAAANRRPERATCRRPGAARSSAASSPRSIFAVLLIVLFKRPVGAALALGAFMLVFYIPAGYYIDMTMWRRRERARIRARGRAG